MILGYFEIMEMLPSLNEVIRQNRRSKFAGSAMKSGIDDIIALYIYRAVGKGTLSEIDKRCEINITWFEKTKKRDVDNIQSSQKFILDSLQKTGIIKNDSQRYVSQIHHTIKHDSENHVFVEIIESEEE